MNPLECKVENSISCRLSTRWRALRVKLTSEFFTQISNTKIDFIEPLFGRRMVEQVVDTVVDSRFEVE